MNESRRRVAVVTGTNQSLNLAIARKLREQTDLTVLLDPPDVKTTVDIVIHSAMSDVDPVARVLPPKSYQLSARLPAARLDRLQILDASDVALLRHAVAALKSDSFTEKDIRERFESMHMVQTERAKLLADESPDVARKVQTLVGRLAFLLEHLSDFLDACADKGCIRSVDRDDAQ